MRLPFADSVTMSLRSTVMRLTYVKAPNSIPSNFEETGQSHSGAVERKARAPRSHSRKKHSTRLGVKQGCTGQEMVAGANAYAWGRLASYAVHVSMTASTLPHCTLRRQPVIVYQAETFNPSM